MSEKKNQSGEGFSTNISGNFQILLVDDNADFSLLVCRILKQMGFESDQAGTGAECLELVRRKSYDLILARER